MRKRIFLTSGASRKNEKTGQIKRMTEERTRALLTNIPDVVWTTGYKGNTTFISPNVEKVYGYRPEEIYKKGRRLWFGRIHRDDIKKVMKAYKLLFGKRAKFDIEYRIKRKDGKWIWLRDKAVITYKENGIMYADGLFSDITAEKNAREELNLKNSAIESLISSVAITDLHTRFIYANKACVDMLGLKSDKEILGKIAYKFVRGPDKEKARKSTKQVIKRGSFSDELLAHRKDGSSFWIKYYTSLVKNNAGKPIGMITSGNDITELKRANEQLRESLEELKTIFDNMVDGILIADVQSKRFYTGNKAICQMLDYNLEEIRNMTVLDIHPKEDLPYIMKSFEKQLKGKSLAKDLPVKRKNGEVFYVDINAFPLRLGGKTYLMGLFRDVTEHKKLQEELEDYQKQIARAQQLSLIGTLSAALVHELSQPLTAIRLYIENCLFELEKKTSPDFVCTRLKDALNSISEANSVVRRFRGFANISAAKKGRVDVMNTAKKIVEMLEESAQRARVDLQLKDLKMPTIYSSNEKDMENLFFALIENAIQAADGHTDHQLIISGDVRGQEVEIRFTDDCGGIEPENVDKIFEPFFTTKPAEKGMGFGLCMVQRIVSQAGGRIRVENQYGKGTTFIVNLPIKGNIKA